MKFSKKMHNYYFEIVPCHSPIFLEKLYFGVVEGSIPPCKSQCTIEVSWHRALKWGYEGQFRFCF